jgi:hypothetical protein
MLAIVEGISPVTLFLSRVKETRAVNLEIEEGIVPESLGLILVTDYYSYQ